MKKIKVLIVGDMPSTSELIKLAVEKYNSQNKDFEITVVAETPRSEKGIEIIKDMPDIQIVFLDHNLFGKNGFHLSRQYPSLAYILISSEPKIEDMATEEKRLYNHPYMERVTNEGAFDLDDIMLALQKCIAEYKL